MRHPILTLAAFTIIFLGYHSTNAADLPGTKDVVMIIGVSPEKVVSGEEIELAVKVAYTLQSFDSGAIRLSANVLSANGERNIASVAVKRGTGEVTLRAKTIPRYWSDVAPFGVNAALVVAAGETLLTRALSVDHANLHVQPAIGEKPAYVDGLSIVTISPERFSEGTEQEVVVKVRYELFSREEAQIVLAVSDGRTASRRRIGVAQVTIGRGELEVRAKFFPKKTAGLPAARLLAALSEPLGNRPSTPLAWDEATITVE